MWFYCRILQISSTALLTNETVLQKTGQEHKLLCCIEQKQLKFLVHVIHKRQLEYLTLSGRIPGKHERGAQCFTFINNLKHVYQNLKHLWDAAQNRTEKASVHIKGWKSHDA